MHDFVDWLVQTLRAEFRLSIGPAPKQGGSSRRFFGDLLLLNGVFREHRSPRRRGFSRRSLPKALIFKNESLFPGLQPKCRYGLRFGSSGFFLQCCASRGIPFKSNSRACYAKRKNGKSWQLLRRVRPCWSVTLCDWRAVFPSDLFFL